MGVRIDGKVHAERIKAGIAADVTALVARLGVQPTLATVLVGMDPASAIYVLRKVEQAEAIGMRSISYHRDASTTQSELLALISELNDDASVHGILVQLPLPSHISKHSILSAIDPAKDVDGFHPVNVGRLVLGEDTMVPCTPAGCMFLLERHVDKLRGKHALVVGASNVVGRPMIQLLLQRGCTVSVAHIDTVDLPTIARTADVLIAATGTPGLVRGNWVKPGAVIIDVGINRVTDRASGKPRIVGDVRYDEAAPIAGAITPVPGGVGPMTIAFLLSNTLKAARRQASLI